MRLRYFRLARSNPRWLSAALAILLLIGSMPLLTGIEIVSGASETAFTMNLCHPLESATAVAPLLLARPATISLRPVLIEFGPAPRSHGATLAEFSLEPESPPPETAV